MTGLFRLAFTVDAATAEGVEQALETTIGERLVALARLDEGAGTWTMEALFADAPERAEITAILQKALGRVPAFDLAPLADRDWIAESLEGLAPVAAGRFVIHGAHDRQAVPTSAIGIEIEAGQAFGTGHHATTRGCLEALSLIAKHCRPRGILDLGTGTGVLAIAAARLWRVRVIATDIDPVAVAVARANVTLNRAGEFVRMASANGTNHALVAANAPYDLVFGNILARPLMRLATPTAAIVSQRSKIVLSGLLEDQAAMVLAAWRSHGFALIRRLDIDGWTTLILSRARGGNPPRRNMVRS